MNDEEKLELTPAQWKAFEAFEKGYEKCKKAGIIFYQNLNYISAINGKHVHKIHDNTSGDRPDIQIDTIKFPFISDSGFDAWADDTHYIQFKEEK
jgi:hypothetical protein